MSVDPRTQGLFEAIAATNYLRVKYAIDSGVSINTPNALGQTPLAMACRQGNLEIIDLLVAAGAQMQAQTDNISAARPHNNELAASNRPQSPVLPTDQTPELPRSPANVREISFEHLLDLIDPNDRPVENNATEIDQIIPIERQPLNLPTRPDRAELHQTVAQWQDISSDAEATYTFDLDEVFAANNAPDLPAKPDSQQMFTDELTMTSIDRPAADIAFEAGETYAFDLSPELDRLTIESVEELDRLAVPMEEWGDTETYVVDNLDGFGLGINSTEIPVLPEFQAHQPNDADRFFATEADRLTPGETWEEGETYAIDLQDLADFSPLPGVVVIDPDDRSDRHLLADLDSSLFPVVGGEDEPDFDPDTQTSTDIFGHSGTERGEDRSLVPTYEDNATNSSLMAATIDGDLDLVQQAIAAGANLDRYDWHLSYAPLGMAIDRGYPEIVECLLAAGANPHCGSVSATALGLAAERGEVDIVQMLLPRGVDVNAPVGRDGWTALLSAIQNGHRAVVQLLVTAGSNVNVWSRGETPILLAAKCEEREIYNYLYPLVNTSIRLCADRDGEHLLQATRKRRIREQNRPVEKLIEMATVGNVEEITRAIEIGVEIDELGAKGHTALMVAAERGHRAIVTILLNAGADPNLLSDDDGLGSGMTALMLAASSFFASNRHQVVKLLINGGADVNQRGAAGKTAIMSAALAGAGYVDCVETLIAAGADLDLLDDRGHTVLTSVAAAENYPMFNLLMQAGASTVGLESIQLIHAASAGNIDRVKALLAANVNLDLDRGAAIGNAAAAGHTQIVELLIQAGANVNLRDKLGFTPIASAAYAGYREIVQLLIDAGADIHAPAGESQSYSALEYAQMGLYQFDFRTERLHQRDDLQHAQIIRLLQNLGAR
jgi:ankyrin repeat protein